MRCILSLYGDRIEFIILIKVFIFNLLILLWNFIVRSDIWDYLIKFYYFSDEVRER